MAKRRVIDRLRLEEFRTKKLYGERLAEVGAGVQLNTVTTIQATFVQGVRSTDNKSALRVELALTSKTTQADSNADVAMAEVAAELIYIGDSDGPLQEISEDDRARFVDAIYPLMKLKLSELMNTLGLGVVTFPWQVDIPTTPVNAE